MKNINNMRYIWFSSWIFFPFMFLNVLISDADAVVHTKPELHSSPSTTGVARERSHTVKEGVCAYALLVPQVYLFVRVCVFFSTAASAPILKRREYVLMHY